MTTQYDSPSGRPIFIPQTSIIAARDSRYRHPANAVAELVDNAIDANARRVEVIVREHEVQLDKQKGYRIHEIAVIDDGIGMNTETLAKALCFGGRTITPGVHKIGKYGYGLPTSSVSQCKRVDVWSWQKGVANAQHTYLDVDEILNGTQQEVTTDQQPPPESNLAIAQNITTTGTLVRWSKVDRIELRPQTIFRHLEEEIGRIYRHYINDGAIQIRMTTFRGTDTTPRQDSEVRPNDPLYLMAPSSTPGKWEQEPMFTIYQEKSFQVTNTQGKTETVDIRYSIVKPEALGIMNGYPGNTDYGRHARRNLGVSVIRENREVVLETSLLDTSAGGGGKPQNRWWGCEVKFGAGCDDMFGIDHNKQMTSHFSHALKELDESSLGDTEARDEIDAGELRIYDVAEHIRRTIRNMMREIKKRFGQRPPANNGVPDPTVPITIAQQAESLATAATEENLASNEKTPTDLTFESTTPEQKISEITDHLTQAGYPEDQSQMEAEITVKSGYRYKFANASLNGYTVFNVGNAAGVLVVQLNINHPIYQFLENIEKKPAPDIEHDSAEKQAAMGIRIMILALARIDDESTAENRLKFQDTCNLWGPVMHKIIDEGISNVTD